MSPYCRAVGAAIDDLYRLPVINAANPAKVGVRRPLPCFTHMPNDRAAPAVQWIRANGLEFAYLARGEGPLVLCLHGFPDTAWSFVPLLEALAGAGFRAVAPFMRGYTPTSIPADGDYRVATLGRDALALIEHFGAAQAHLVGHDWGAAASYAAASLRPDRVRSIVTAAVPHLRRFVLRPTLKQLRRSRYMGLFQLRGVAEKIVTRNDLAYIDALIREWSPGWEPPVEAFAALKAMLRQPDRLAAALGYYRAMPRSLGSAEGLRLLNARIAVPARVICGVNDGCIGREMFEGQESRFAAGYELVEIAGAGHFMHLERPAEFAEAVVSFLR
jgi:pimeloyl-ACP methyl ester carboxylesterase